jgi:hypothetical protein
MWIEWTDSLLHTMDEPMFLLFLRFLGESVAFTFPLKGAHPVFSQLKVRIVHIHSCVSVFDMVRFWF